MNIEVTYTPTAKTLANASSLFIEKKPFLLGIVTIVNLLAGLLIVAMIAKLFVLGLTPQEWSAAIVALIWIFGRRPFNEWLLYRKMKKSSVINKPITITLSGNGIIWSGEQLKKGEFNWNNMSYVMETQNGWICPYSATKFLWLPFDAFKNNDEIEELRTFFKERQIACRLFKKWTC